MPKRGVTRLKGWGTALLAMSLLFSGTAVAQDRTYVTDCYDAKIKPGSILFACADGGYSAKHLRWKKWHVKKAVGHGTFHFNDCNPDCADGTFHKRKGKLVLKHRLWCPDIKKHVFKRAKITYNKPWHGDSRQSFGLYCPLG